MYHYNIILSVHVYKYCSLYLFIVSKQLLLLLNKMCKQISCKNFSPALCEACRGRSVFPFYCAIGSDCLLQVLYKG